MKISASVFDKFGTQVCVNRPAADSSVAFRQMVASYMSPAQQPAKPVVLSEQATDTAPTNLSAAVQVVARAGASAKALIENERMKIDSTALELEKSLSTAQQNEPTRLIGNDSVSLVVGSRGKAADPWDRYRAASVGNSRESGDSSSGRGFYVGIRIAIG